MVLDVKLIVPVIIGLSEVIKKAGLESRYIPLLSIVLGLCFAFWIGGTSAWLDGIMVGLMSCGLFSSVKATLGK